MKESVKSRIQIIKMAEESTTLKKHLCPFFITGEYPECITCKQSDSDLEECKEYYLSRIVGNPMDIWDETFEQLIVKERPKIPMREVVGIGVNCDSCYMYDKCPSFKSGFVCGIEWGGQTPETPDDFYTFLVEVQYERVKRASVYEKIDGGVPDANLSGELDRLSNLVMSKVNAGREHFSLKIDASSPAGGSGGGILAKLFAPTPPKEEPQKQIEEAVVIASASPRKKPKKE
jgi:hypothetical protein